ncbi:MAG: type II secretion system major pseudopilin GspG [Desulfobacteraceae bacterium]|nr:type II secretion system major pseudopilin GspG [Desulfobacteraceae bacterium]
MQNCPENKERGFTFLEIMVVVVILGLLATYIAPRFMDKADDAKIVKARMDIAAIETSLKMYRLDSGVYPTTDQGLLALIEKPSSEPIPTNWSEKGYLEKSRIPKDPWNREYLYISPGVNGDFDIISYGADGEAGGDGKNKDINSWEIE